MSSEHDIRREDPKANQDDTSNTRLRKIGRYLGRALRRPLWSLRSGDHGRRTANATVFLAIATLLLALVAGGQVYDTHQAFVISQRAFVYIDKVQWRNVEKEEAISVFPVVPGYGKDVKRIIELTVIMKNSGNTPANKLRILVDCPVGPPKVEDPFDRFTWHESKAVLQPLGPHQESEIGPCAELNSDNVGGNALGLVPIYVIGEIRYFDNVEPKKERTTQFSKQVRFLGEDVSHLNGRVVSVGKHNCADDDCVARRSE